ncbi:DUF6339 family protein [Corynebacterium sp. H128]|uniref:DUF6339 family protein n=1 Tax=Corynebacterium sp. H128 TaxID=3133427 RepID=UPI0030A32FE7
MMVSNEVESIFTEDAVVLLAIKLDRVDCADEFFAYVDDLARDPKYLLRLPQPISFGEDLRPNSKFDSESAISLFEAVGDLDRANASDIRLWTYLALVPFRSYMWQRWPLGEKENFKKTIENRWMLTNSSRRKLIRHGIARLWWVAYLTFDPKKEYSLSAKNSDEFAFTKWVLEKQDRVQNILENEIGSSEVVRWAICEVAAEYEGTKNKEIIKSIARETNAIAGYQNLDTFEPAELRHILRSSVVHLMEQD